MKKLQYALSCTLFLTASATSSFPLDMPKTEPEQQAWEVKFDKRDPVVQYDTQTGRKKALAFIPEDADPYSVKMRRPAVYHLHIPASERVE